MMINISKNIKQYLFISLIFAIFFSHDALGNSYKNIFKEEMIEVSFVSSITNFDSNKPFYIGLKFDIEDDWKIYWKHPGDSGMPPEVDLSNSVNVNYHKILWPFPTKEYEAADLLTNVYKRSVILPIQINVFDNNSSLNLRGIVNFQVCKEICIPLTAYLKLDIDPGIAINTSNYFNIMKELSNVPVSYEDLGINNLEVSLIKSNKLLIKIDSLLNFPDGNFDLFIETLNEYVKINEINIKKNSKKSIHAEILLDSELDKLSDISIIGVKGNMAFTAVTNIIDYKNNKNLYLILLLSIVGGIILNFMPCVLPVLILKVSRLLVQHGKCNKEVRYSFISTSLGIIFSFLVLALMTIILKYLGIEVGWGTQFQQPIFIGILILVLLIFAANLFDLFEFSLPNNFSTSINNFINSRKYGIPFFEGSFATLLATPCSAPFLGTAIGFAFTAEPIIIILIFLFLGIGMSLPYLLVSCFPSIINYFPRPGNWINYLRFMLAIGLFLTALWLLTILVTLIGIKYSAIFLFIIIISLLIFNINISYRKFLVIFLSVFITFFLSSFISNNNLFKSGKNELAWEDFDQNKIKILVEQNRSIFVDITADWCITCKVNKLLVLDDKKFSDIVKKYNLVLMRGDLTKPNKDIMLYMKKFDRYGIPFNAIYSVDNSTGILLSELLTIKEIQHNLK